MHKQRLAEWILSIVTTPARASAQVGDLLENGCGPLAFWAAIGSTLLRAVTWKELKESVIGFSAQFVFLVVLLTPMIQVFSVPRLPPETLHWVLAAISLCTQVLTALWIGRAGRQKPVLVSLLISLFDCILGLFNVNNVSINMAVWSIPLLLTSVVLHRRGYEVVSA
jgi:hypothetical protein